MPEDPTDPDATTARTGRLRRAGLVLALAIGTAACGLAPNVPDPSYLWTRNWLTGQRPPEGTVHRDAMGNPVLSRPPAPPATEPSAPRP